MDEPVETDGVQFLERRQGSERIVINQRVKTRIEDDRARVDVASNVSGRHRGLDLTHPEAIAALRLIDRAQRAAAIADRPPLPEPEREPLPHNGQPPSGHRWCATCGASGLHPDEFGAEAICPNCGGLGWVVKGIEAWRHDR